MARIVLAPNALELGILGEEYALVQRDLEAQGHEVELRDQIEERRSVDPTTAIAFTVAVSLYVGQRVAQPTLDEIGRVLRDRLVARFRLTRPRKALIFGEDGRTVISEVDLPNEEPPPGR
jgi:hypothetical protein